MIAAGSQAPAFRLRHSQYRDVTLDDLRGKRLVVVFYVADWHPVCTSQLLRYCELLAELQRLGANLVAISADSIWSHTAFASAYQLPFPPLSDDCPRGNTAHAYGVKGAERGLCVIDTEGTIAWSATFPDAIDPGVDGVLTALER
jgi:peroxiredoxin